jgi:site-specific DNA recombinase
LSSYHGEIMGNAVWPALVPLETWQAVCKILSDASRRINGDHRGGTVRWLGSGLYVCGVCLQADLRVGSSSGKRHSYRCRNREMRNGTGHVTREANALDRYVEELLVKRISDPRVLKKLRQTPASNGIDTRALQVELTALGTREDNPGSELRAGQDQRAGDEQRHGRNHQAPWRDQRCAGALG